MKDEQIDDLKQFITATISQTEKRLEIKIADLRGEMRGEMATIRGEMVDGFAGIGEAIEDLNNRLDDHYREIDTRLTKLEHQAV